ncbi:MAG TPA: RdgB/HAM1 family non-canonical purine NTP pyrophosphatase [Alphaproteobacteria bacterium]|nr:RdgB/HAM1 family non-canonical purine NTP pyrophosphatase [Alphaproteobacteria bacterium]
MKIETLVIATHNKGKVAEFEKLLAGTGIILKSAADFNLPEPEETEETFVGNALLKARAAVEMTGLPCLADDSGLEISILDGAPGVYSARWAETPSGERDFNFAMQRVHDAVAKSKAGPINGTQTANFRAVLALVFPGGQFELFEGWMDGRLCWPPRGDNGHGYDPIFVPDNYDISFAEMTAEEKNKTSHRGFAVQKFRDYLLKNAA